MFNFFVREQPVSGRESRPLVQMSSEFDFEALSIKNGIFLALLLIGLDSQSITLRGGVIL